MPRVSVERARAQRERIITAAVQVFAERGYGPTTIDAVCQVAGLSKGAVYTYVASKEELFLAASEHVFERRYATLADAARGGDVDALLAAFTGSLEQDQRAFLRLWVEGFLLAEAIPDLAALKAGYHERFAGLLVDVLQAAQRGGSLDPALDARSAAVALMALADGLLLHALVPGSGPAPEQAASVLTDLFVPWRGGSPS
ncbi:MAG: TetR/AcrR family transcriptional regulator [Actinomycetales bacterium]|nr:TetR/AcrR family transcriptional regulator [Actinomycetales bacterium]